MLVIHSTKIVLVVENESRIIIFFRDTVVDAQ